MTDFNKKWAELSPLYFKDLMPLKDFVLLFCCDKELDEAVELIIERDERIQILENRLKEYEKENC